MSVWIAKLLGPVILSASIPMVLDPAGLHEMAKRFLADRPLVFVSGVLALTAGLAIVNTHNLWVWDWRLIITIFGWALVIGGFVRITAPGAVDRIGGTMLEHQSWTRMIGILWALLGCYLTIKGYV